jgi:hypothetical protein
MQPKARYHLVLHPHGNPDDDSVIRDAPLGLRVLEVQRGVTILKPATAMDLGVAVLSEAGAEEGTRL